MKRCFGLLAAIALLALALPALASASMVLFACTPVRCVAVSDSRAMVFDVSRGDTATKANILGHRDDYCKLAFAGRFIFAATNDTEAEASGGLGVFAAWQRLPPQENETAAQYLARLVAALPEHMVSSRWPLSAGVAVFKFGLLPDAVVATVRCESGGKPQISGREDAGVFPIIAILGADDVDFAPIRTRLRVALARNPTEAETVAMLQAEIRAAARETVGGPLWTVVIDAASGRRWKEK
jgi:hypothetical protein